jgi:hypothetical protein
MFNSRLISKQFFSISLLIAGLSLFGFGTFSLIASNSKLARAAQTTFSSFQHGISNDTDWGSSQNIATVGSGYAKLVSGPWVLNGWQEQNTQWLTALTSQTNQSKMPYIYLYIVAGSVREDLGIQDCNVGTDPSKTLCKAGADYVRNNSDKILNRYKAAANKIKEIYGTSKTILLHVEPDFYQYNSNSQNNGGLTSEQAGNTINRWTDSIKNILPNAKLVMDISPWNTDIVGWSSMFRNFDFAGLVGKRFDPSGDGSVPNGIDGKTYKQLSDMTGKNLIINDAHGAGGAYLNYNKNWERKDLIDARWQDGVVAVLQSPTDLKAFNAFVDSYNVAAVPTPVPTPTPTVTPGESPTVDPKPIQTNNPLPNIPSETPTPTPSPTPVPTSTFTPTPTPTPTPVRPTPSPTPNPIAVPTPTPSPTPTSAPIQSIPQQPTTINFTTSDLVKPNPTVNVTIANPSVNSATTEITSGSASTMSSVSNTNDNTTIIAPATTITAKETLATQVSNQTNNSTQEITVRTGSSDSIMQIISGVLIIMFVGISRISKRNVLKVN